MNALVGWKKNIDTAALTADSQAGALGVSKLKSQTVADVYRSGDENIGLVADFRESIDLNATMLAGVNSTQVRRRVRVSDTDTTGKAGELYDSGWADAGSNDFDGRRGFFLHVLPSTVTGRYLRVDLEDQQGKASNLEAGRWWAGTVIQPDVNFEYGWGLGVRDLSQQRQGPGGQVFVTDRPKQQTITVRFTALTPSEVRDLADALAYDVGLNSDFLLVPNVEEGKVALDAVWGYLETLRNRSEPNFQRFSYRLTVVERK